MRILVTGSRQLTEQRPVYAELGRRFLAWVVEGAEGEFVVVHGAAPGADAFAGQWVYDMRDSAVPPSVEVHPAEWRKYGRRAGHIRNHEMVVLGADVVLAFFVAGAGNVGTRNCVEEANRWLAHKGAEIKEIWT